MVASIGVIASPSQGVSYYERDGYYARDDPAHKEASAWAGKGAREMGLSGPVDPDTFKAVLEGRVPDGPHLGKRTRTRRSTTGRAGTLSAPKSVSLMALLGGDERIVVAHDQAVTRTLAWLERNAVETRVQDKESGAMVRVGGQKMVAATFRHETSRNLDPQLHTHAVIANMVQGWDGKCVPARVHCRLQPTLLGGPKTSQDAHRKLLHDLLVVFNPLSICLRWWQVF